MEVLAVLVNKNNNKLGTGQEWLNFGWTSLYVEYDAMHCCSIAQSQLGPVNIEHNNGGDDGDDGKADDHDIYRDHVHNYS